jgi:hypothetical protein
VSEMQTTTEAFPTQGGEYSAYVPEWFSGDKSVSPDGWQDIRIAVIEATHGVPVNGGPTPGINSTIGMYTKAAATALAWQFAAMTEARDGHVPKVRVVGYRVRYDIKCYRELEQA